MSIDTGNSEPVSQKPYPITMKHYQWVKDKIEKLFTAKVIWRSRSSWSAPIIVIPKGDRGKNLLIDYWALNKVIRKFIWPMPKVEDIFSHLSGTKYFSTLDLWPGYHHIPLDEESIPKTAITSRFGKYEYIKVPFGLAQAPAYFQELMTGILKDFNFPIAYLDDIIIFSKTAEEHLDHIKQVFQKLRNTQLSIKLSKCHFFTKEIQYLGHILSTKGIKQLPSKTQAIQNMHPPKTPKRVCAFNGPVGYYQKFIKKLYKNSKTFDIINSPTGKIWVDTNPSQCFLNPQGISHPSINLTLCKSEEMLHRVYKCIWWCLWSTTFPGTWWYGIFYSFPFAHIHWYSMKMEHHRTRSLWCILCSHEVELLPPGSWNNSQKWPQATGKISTWQKCKYQSQQMGTRTSTYTLPSPEQQKIRGLSQISQSHPGETMWKGSIKLGQVYKSSSSQLQSDTKPCHSWNIIFL